MNQITDNSYKGQWIITLLVITGIFTAYIHQIHPSALLPIIMKDLNLNLTQGGLVISIIFPPIIISSILGGYFQEKIGFKNLYLLTLVFLGAGILMNYVVNSYYTLLLARVLYGIGFGLSMPFIGAAIMMWYKPKQREVMNTLNALFAYFGNFVVFGVTMPMYVGLGNSWRSAIGIWGVFIVLTAVLWIFYGKERTVDINEIEEAKAGAGEKHLYGNLWKRPEVKILGITFICDFFSYTFISGILPTFYQMEKGITLEAANNIATIFPIAGIVGGITAGIILNRTGRRKTLLWLGQAFKLAGIVLIVIGVKSWLGLAGVAMVGLGNCLWIPSLFTIPMDLDDMNPTRVGAAFALITSLGFAAGFIAPVILNWLGEKLSLLSSFGVCGIICAIGLIACLMMRETGPGARVNVN